MCKQGRAGADRRTLRLRVGPVGTGRSSRINADAHARAGSYLTDKLPASPGALTTEGRSASAGFIGTHLTCSRG